MAGSARETKVVLTAQVAGYLSGMEQASSKTKQTAAEAAKLEAQLQKQHAAMTQLGTGLLAFGAVAAAGVALAVSKYADFDQQMSAVQAATRETAGNMALLRDAAMEAGAVTAYSATEAAGAIEALAKAGLTTEDILGGGLTGAMSLAAAGGLEVADAAEVTAISLKQFGLNGDQASHVADLLAAGAGKAVGDVSDLGAALGQVGLVANGAGQSIEDTTGVLAAFADAGLIGSDSGTSLKSAIIALQAPTDKSRTIMEKYNLAFYDGNGQMLSYQEIAGQLKTRLGGLDDETRNAALAQIFGNDALRSANVLYEQGQEGIQGYIDRTNDYGFAAEDAAIKQNNLAGDLEKLGGAFDTLLIKTGAAANGPLRLLVQSVTELVDAFSESPPVVQQAALGLGVIAAAVGLAGGAVLVAVPKLYELKVALDVLSASSIPGVGGAAKAMTKEVSRSAGALADTAKFLTGPWGVALVAATIGVELLAKYLDSLKASSEEVSNSLITAKDSAEIFRTVSQGRDITAWADVNAQLSDLPKLLDEASEQSGNLFARFSGSEYFGAIAALKDVGKELGDLAGTDLPAAQRAFNLMAQEAGLSDKQMLQLLDSMPAYKDALTQQASAAGIAANDTNLLELAQGSAKDQAVESAKTYLDQATAVDEVTSAIEDLLKQFNDLNGVNQDAISTNAAYQESLAGIAEDVQAQKDAYEKANGSLQGFNLSLDENTVSGSANASSLAGVAKSAQDAAFAQFQVDQSTMSAKAAADKYSGTLADQRAKFEASASAAGYNADQVKALADKVFALPTSKQVAILADTAQAQSAIDGFITTNNGKTVRVVAQVDTSGARSTLGGLTQADGGVVDYFADGGMSENHVAQIAPAGAWRVWAEPETGGEAYIPLSPSKRDRSIAVWEETGRRLNAFADGGMWQAAVGMYGGQFGGNVVNNNQRFEISAPANPVAVAQEVQRRQNRLGV